MLQNNEYGSDDEVTVGWSKSSQSKNLTLYRLSNPILAMSVHLMNAKTYKTSATTVKIKASEHPTQARTSNAAI